MGQTGSMEDDPKVKAVVKKLSKLEIKDLEAVFLELSSETHDGESVIKQPTWLNRDKFAELLGTTELVVEQLFEAFDRDQNGLIDLEEFVTGMALVLHGSIKVKCQLLFKIFNLNGDDGVSHDELTTVLTSCLQSTHHLLVATLKSEGISGYENYLSDQTEDAVMVSVVVDKIVKDAFNKCDVSRTGKLELDEFVHWVQKNPKLMNNLFVLYGPKPSTGSSRSNPSVSSQFSVVEPESLETATGNVFDEDDTTEVTQPTTLLHMANLVDSNKQSLQNLFSQPTGLDDESFFDTLSADDIKLDEKVLDSSIPRPSSQLFAPRPFTQNVPLSNSETNISQLAMNKHTSTVSHSAGEVGSMQSITLSCDDLNEGSKVPEVTQVTEETTATEDSINVNQDNIWHPLQNQTKNPDSLSYTGTIEEPVDVSKQFITENITETEASSSSILAEDQCTESKQEMFQSIYNKAISDNEKISHNFWQPSYHTTQLLNSIEHGQSIDKTSLTFPSVLVEGFMGDPVKDLVTTYLGEQEASKRMTHHGSDMELNENALKKLLASECWRAAIDLTTKYLTNYGQGISSVDSNQQTLLTPSIMQIWFVRIALLVKLRRFSSAEAELNAFHDFEGPDMYYQYYPKLYPGKKGSIVPFSFRLLHAELPQHNGRPNVALDRLYYLLNRVKQIVQNLSNGSAENGDKSDEVEGAILERLNIWKDRYLKIHYAIGNCFLGMKEYTLAIKIFEQIIEMEPDRKYIILSAIGRIHLQFGDLKMSKKYFEQVQEMTLSDIPEHASTVHMNSGYLALAKGSYEEAYEHFTKLPPENLAGSNNTAVCLLFLGNVKEASHLLESTVMQSPVKGLQEDILFNLNTIYELETSRALQKKYKLLDMVNKYKGDGFNAQSLKLS